MESPLDHNFVNYQVNIMQSCDQCSSYIWGMEKAYMCNCEFSFVICVRWFYLGSDIGINLL